MRALLDIRLYILLTILYLLQLLSGSDVLFRLSVNLKDLITRSDME